MSEWQPIETAPKDENLLMACLHDDKKPNLGWHIEVCSINSYEPLDDQYSNCFTHWMPLPKPPEAI
jgi:Protein of unknown function (DUF551)